MPIANEAQWLGLLPDKLRHLVEFKEELCTAKE